MLEGLNKDDGSRMRKAYMHQNEDEWREEVQRTR